MDFPMDNAGGMFYEDAAYESPDKARFGGGRGSGEQPGEATTMADESLEAVAMSEIVGDAVTQANPWPAGMWADDSEVDRLGWSGSSRAIAFELDDDDDWEDDDWDDDDDEEDEDDELFFDDEDDDLDEDEDFDEEDEV